MSKQVDVLAVLDGLQFGFNHRRCPRCAGWNMSENGETDNIHTPDCDVPKARAAISELIEAANQMLALAIGPAGGVSMTEKREAIERLSDALAAASAKS